MANENESSSAIVDVAKYVFDSMWNWDGAGDLGRWVLLFAVVAASVVFALIFLLRTVVKVIEALAKLADLYKASGLPMPMSSEDRDRVRRRSQFCAVLDSDLAQIAKSESWNDQYFTDLEAEVESEGGYYASAFHKLIGRRSQGLRKERSLIKAITKSTERAVQLIGEPGAGKSVALRHLASQLAARGKKSKDKHAIVPLYINLREMSANDLDKVNADLIKEFILDNIRRGDSDTSAFVRDNWKDYRDKGIWFFLFDSFDEIPAVLHAEKGSAAAAAYTQAIRQFLEGMGTCKGVLASREFKGPEDLPWKKFRILPLHGEKQLELVKNTFLTREQERIVLHHLAYGGPLGATPLFLTLLCRYVRSEGRSPTNDYDLLSLHIDRLARREPDYLKRKYNLTPVELLAGAEEVARLFAEQPSLGLAPALDQIAALVQVDKIPGGDVGLLVSALVDCKIGRADVPNAAQGDRRFAFAHRRYQETLFVRFLVGNPNHLAPTELLTDPRWREYSVTLLQTEPLDNLRPLLDQASVLLQQRAASQQRLPARNPAPSGCGYFSWKTELGAYLLELLQEGLARRREDVPEALSKSALSFLRPRWELGDALDRYEVVRLSALLPQLVLTRYIATTFRTGTARAEAVAFQQTTALRGKAPRVVGEAVLRHLSAETLASTDTAALLRLEALTARLPVSVGAITVYRRNLRLRAVLNTLGQVTRFLVPIRMMNKVEELVDQALFGTIPSSRHEPQFMHMLALGTIAIAQFVTTLVHVVDGHFHSEVAPRSLAERLSDNNLGSAIQWWGETTLLAKWPMLISLAVLALYLILVVVYSLRAKGEPLGVRYFLKQMTDVRTLKRHLRSLGLATVLMVTLSGGIYFVGEAAKWGLVSFGLLGEEVSPVLVGFAVVIGGGYLFGLIPALFTLRKVRRALNELQTARSLVKDDLKVILSMRQPMLLASCLARVEDLAAEESDNRSLSSLLLAVVRGQRMTPLPQLVDPSNGLDKSEMQSCLQLLEDRLET